MKIKSLYNTLRRFLLVSLVTCCAVFGYSKASVHATEADKARAFAGFIKHIYLNTKTTKNGNNFCIFGSDEVSVQISSIIPRGSINDVGDEIDIERNYNECRVIYISKNKEKDAKYSTKFFNNKGALTIATFAGFTVDGGMMSVEVGRRNFELTVNELAMKEFGVKIDSSIVSLIVN